jgi:hypothetical protein
MENMKHVKLFEGFLNEASKWEKQLSEFQSAIWTKVKKQLKPVVKKSVDGDLEIFYNNEEMPINKNQLQLDFHGEEIGDDEDGDESSILSVRVTQKKNGTIVIEKWVQLFKGNGGDDVDSKNHVAKTTDEAADIVSKYLNDWN